MKADRETTGSWFQGAGLLLLPDHHFAMLSFWLDDKMTSFHFPFSLSLLSCYPCVRVHLCVHTLGSLRLMSWVNHSPSLSTLFIHWGSLSQSNSKLPQIASLDNQLALGSPFCLPRLVVTGRPLCSLSIFMVSRDRNFGSHICTMSVFTAES